MGNRAVITTTKRDMGVYLHWNGGRDSVEGFLEYCHMRGFRSPECDDYGWARLCQVVGNFMGASGLSVGIWPYPGDAPALEAGSDNGVYVTEGWRVVGRVLPWDGFHEQDEYPLRDMLLAIDAAQPEGQRLGGYLLAEEVAVGEVELGDSVYMRQVSGAYEAFEVIGFGERPVVHSDRGGHCRWPGWIGICRENRLVRSMSRKGRSCDNVRMEGSFGTLKREFFRGRGWEGADRDGFMVELHRWLKWFRSGRISESLGWRTPDESRRLLGYAV